MILDGRINTILELIECRAADKPDGVFLVSPETGCQLTFLGLRDQVLHLAVRLRQMGLKKGDKVAFLLDNGLYTAQLFLGTMAAGFVAVPLNTRAGVSSLVYTLDHCDASVVFIEAQYQELNKQIQSGLKRPVPAVVANVDTLATDDKIEVPEPALSQGKPEPQDVALLMYTSGSTSKPKAAIHSHRTVLAHGANSIAAHQLTADDRSLLVLPLYHINAECVTLIPTLLSGGTVVIPRHFSVSHFWDWLDEYHCTWSAVVPTIVSQLLDWKDTQMDRRQAMFKRIRFLRSSSAPLSPALHREFLAKFDVRLIQAMGSSECGNIFSNPQAPGENKIGSPGLPWGFDVKISNPKGEAVEQGEPGEILLRGPAMMQGYYKDAESTAAVVDAEGWFHTGDLAYRDPDGYLFVVGRSKELIIKGGVNIAPKQIDEVLESHPLVLEAAAVGVPDRYVGEDLVAFVVFRAGKMVEERELLSFCENRLGHFKTPSRIYFANDLPKGPSGKIQRLKLREQVAKSSKPKPSANGSAANGQGERPVLAAKPTPIEQTITGIWMELLKQPHVGLQSNFFSLGGHSLLAIQSLSKLRERVPISLSLSDFFENATVAQLAALIRKRLRPDDLPGFQAMMDWEQEVLKQIGVPADPDVIPPRDRSKPIPLSPAQERLWFLEKLNSGVPVYNESEAVRFEGNLNVDVLQEALDIIVNRLDVFRSTIQVVNDQPVVVVDPSWRLILKRVNLLQLKPEERQAELARLLIEEPRRPYKLESEPGIRATLIQVGPQDHAFILMMHHLICDWSSEGVIWRELSTLYRALLKGEPPLLPPLGIQYGDYAAWQREQMISGSFEEDLAYWKQQLQGIPAHLELPADRMRPGVNTYRGARKRFTIGSALVQLLRECSREEKVSLFTIFTAALDVLLYRYTGGEDICLGIPLADRDRPELQNVVGFLLHTHVLRTRLSGRMSFRELLGVVQKGVLELYTHRSPPFDQVVNEVHPERNLSYSPLFQVMINWRDRDQQLSFIGMDGLKVTSLLSETRTAKFDLTFMLTEDEDEISLELEYSTDLFEEWRIDRMAGHYQTLLEGIVANPEQSLAALPLLTDFERQQILGAGNRTAQLYPSDCLHELFEHQARLTPDAVAVVFQQEFLSYRQLDERASRLAAYLQELGVGTGSMVGICLERSLEMVVGLLGILKAGGAYVPMDPSYPQDRVAFMIEDSKPKVLITQQHLLESLPKLLSQVVLIDSDWSKINEARSIVRKADSGKSKSENLAYVLFTSGSTGKPKGVQIPHRAVVNFLQSMRQKLEFSAQEVLLAVTTLSFDIAGLEIFLPLTTGARVVIASRDVAADGARLSLELARSGATIMQATPATWRLLLESGWKGSPLFKILCGGEAWSIELASELLTRCGALWNLYGPTETTIWSAASKVQAGQPVLIGAPIANTQFYILDSAMQPVPVGIPGELWIGGDGLALGYLNRPELTAEKFIPDPFRSESGARLYRTGDLVRYLPDGNIEYLGRMDNQVKLRGFRIELGEIETLLAQHPAVRAAAVVAREETAGEKRLAAYLISKSAKPPETSELREFLQSKLPEYMVPSAFVNLERFPMTPNGKVDRKAFPKPEIKSVANETAPPATPAEIVLAKIWSEVLGVKNIGLNDNFFDLGGHSLLAMRVIEKTRQSFDKNVAMNWLFTAPTISQFSKLLEVKPDSASGLSEGLRGRGNGTPFFYVPQIHGFGFMPGDLARHLNDKVRYFDGLQYPGLNGGEPLPRTVEEIAAYIVPQIQAIWPNGPYYLMGWSFGGAMAFEIAHQLQAKGHEVKLVLLIDSRALGPSSKIELSMWESIKRFMQHMSKLHGRERLTLIGQTIARRFGWSPSPIKGNVANQSAGEMTPIMEASLQAARGYSPKPYDGKVVLFQIENWEFFEGFRYLPDPSFGWNKLVRGGLKIVRVPGDHATIVLEPAAAKLAENILEQIELCK